MDTNINNKNPLVSVIMAAYNAEKYIALAIDSILSQTYSNWELVIADDASIDTTSNIINRYAKQDSRIKTIRLDKNSGQAIARNKAIEKALGKYLAIFDADDISLPDRLLKQVEFLESNTDISLVGSHADLIDENGKIIGKKTKPQTDEEIKFPLLLQTQFMTSSVCIKKDVFMETSGFDNTYLYAEDYDLWSRISSMNNKCANIGTVLIQYRMHSRSTAQVPKTQLIQEKNALNVKVRNIARFIDIPRKKLKNLIRFIKNKPLSFFEIYIALYWYRRLVKNYISSGICTKTEASYVKKIYRTKRKHVIKTKIKRLLAL